MGGSAQHVADQDLDKYVVEMIMKEASDSQSKYKAIGLDAYKPSGAKGAGGGSRDNTKATLTSGMIVDRADSNGLKTNKRFLSSIIKSTDDHNQALIRAEKEQSEAGAKELLQKLNRRANERDKEERRRSKAASAGKMRMDEIDASDSRRGRSSSNNKI
ncbi:hypothetical protein BG004_000329 [Podila humilis]|nr:hypothetical protein BG004_000329 [Podila humilis]